MSPPTWILYPAIVCHTFNKAGLAILTGTFCKFWDMHAPLWYVSQRMLKPCLRWSTATLRQWKLSTPIIRLDSRGEFEFGGAAEGLKPCPHLSAELWLAVCCIKGEVSTASATPYMYPGQFLGKVSRCFWQEKKYSWRAQAKRRNCWELPCLHFFMFFPLPRHFPLSPYAWYSAFWWALPADSEHLRQALQFSSKGHVPTAFRFFHPESQI